MLKRLFRAVFVLSLVAPLALLMPRVGAQQGRIGPIEIW